MSISIIIPMYNMEKYINKTLSSLKTQTDKNFEIIVVDDGSTDASYETAKKLLNEFEIIEHKLIRQNNSGVSVARNVGIANATGDYVMFLDGDDYISSQLVQTINNRSKVDEADIICWQFCKVDESYSSLVRSSDIYTVDRKSMSGFETFQNMIDKKFHITMGSAVYNRKMLNINEIEFRGGCTSGEDLEFTFKCLSLANRVDFIHETMFFYLQRDSSVDNSYSARGFDAVFAFKRMILYIRENGSAEFSNFINRIGDEFVIIEYLGKINHSLRLIKTQKISKSKAIKMLFSEIDSLYPTLRVDMISMMKESAVRGFMKRIIVKLFIISPYLYSIIIDVKDMFRKSANG